MCVLPPIDGSALRPNSNLVHKSEEQSCRCTIFDPNQSKSGQHCEHSTQGQRSWRCCSGSRQYENDPTGGGVIESIAKSTIGNRIPTIANPIGRKRQFSSSKQRIVGHKCSRQHINHNNQLSIRWIFHYFQ